MFFNPLKSEDIFIVRISSIFYDSKTNYCIDYETDKEQELEDTKIGFGKVTTRRGSVQEFKSYDFDSSKIYMTLVEKMRELRVRGRTLSSTPGAFPLYYRYILSIPYYKRINLFFLCEFVWI